MVAKGDVSLEEALAKEDDQLINLTLQYTLVMKQILDSAKNNPQFTASNWAPLANLVDVEHFERVGTFKELVRWPEYAELLTDWAKKSYWEPRVRRVTRQDEVVFLELSELATYAEMSDSIFSISVYEFDANKKLRHLDVYMQREQIPLPPGTWSEKNS